MKEEVELETPTNLTTPDTKMKELQPQCVRQSHKAYEKVKLSPKPNIVTTAQYIEQDTVMELDYEDELIVNKEALFLKVI